MKDIINQWFHGTIVQSTGEKLKNLRELRSTKYPNGVRVYHDLVADVSSAKAEIFNSDIKSDPNRYRPRVLSISKTVHP